jgi:hypothetical protein
MIRPARFSTIASAAPPSSPSSITLPSIERSGVPPR